MFRTLSRSLLALRLGFERFFLLVAEILSDVSCHCFRGPLANYFDPMSLAAIYGALHGAFHHGLLWSEVIRAVGSAVLLDFV